MFDKLWKKGDDALDLVTLANIGLGINDMLSLLFKKGYKIDLLTINEFNLSTVVRKTPLRNKEIMFKHLSLNRTISSVWHRDPRCSIGY